MTNSIYQLFMMKPSEAWYQLSKEEQDRLMTKQEEFFNKAGGKTLVFADLAWSSEEWLYFGVNQYPDFESLEKHSKRLAEINRFRYLESKVVLGTEWEQS